MSKNGATPATKGDLTKLREELLEALHDTKTRLHKAFYIYAESAQKHSLDLDRSDSSLRDRLGSLETDWSKSKSASTYHPPFDFFRITAFLRIHQLNDCGSTSMTRAVAGKFSRRAKSRQETSAWCNKLWREALIRKW
jgi:hypothetical protein